MADMIVLQQLDDLAPVPGSDFIARAGEGYLGSDGSDQNAAYWQMLCTRNAALLRKIKSPNSMSSMRTATASNHWKLMFLEFQANLNGSGDILSLGAGDSSQTQLSQVPYAFVIDRVYVHGDPSGGPETRHRAPQPRHGRHQLVRVGVQGHRSGRAGHQRVQRSGQLPD